MVFTFIIFLGTGTYNIYYYYYYFFLYCFTITTITTYYYYLFIIQGQIITNLLAFFFIPSTLETIRVGNELPLEAETHFLHPPFIAIVMVKQRDGAFSKNVCLIKINL